MPLNEGAINEILPFCPDGTEAAGDLVSLEAYEAHTTRLRGHQRGLALREIENRALRQALLVSAGLAQYIANRYAAGVMDNGDLDAIEEGLKSALAAQFPVATTERAGISLRATAKDIAEKTATNKTVSPADLALLSAAPQHYVGEVFLFWDNYGLAVYPDNTIPDGPRYIKLWAGDSFNSGLLTGETVSGSWPDITATATVTCEGSPWNGRTIHLINTEGRFLRAAEPEVLWADAIRNITGGFTVRRGGIIEGSALPGAFALADDGWNYVVRNDGSSGAGLKVAIDTSRVVPVAEENRPRGVGVTAMLRIR